GRGGLDRRGGRSGGRLRVLRARGRYHRAAPAAAGGAVGQGPGDRWPAGRRGAAVRAPGRLHQDHLVDQRRAGRRQAHLPAGRLHPGRREPASELREGSDGSELVSRPVTPARPAQGRRAAGTSSVRSSSRSTAPARKQSAPTNVPRLVTGTLSISVVPGTT